MKVLFVISAMGHGKGGHFHSLDHISRVVASKSPAAIITIGPGRSEVLKKNPYFIEHVDFNGIQLLKFNQKFKRVLYSFKPDILHFFDSISYNIVRPFVSGDIKFVVNKCGGPNPKDFPQVDNLVLFSKENRAWFLNRKKFRNTNISLIPNRATTIVTLHKPDIQKDTSSFCFVRIARIGKAYIKSIKDSILLLDTLKETTGSKLKFYLIGTVQEKDIFNELMNQIGSRSDIVVIIDNKYTQQASKMLYLADAVIATGRGIMEASSLGLPILTPASNSKLPVLITKNNFQNFFATNFSERNKASNQDLEKNLGLIMKLVNDKNFYANISKASKQLFDRYFNIERGYDKYMNAYGNALKSELRVPWYSDSILKLKDFKRCYSNSK